VDWYGYIDEPWHGETRACITDDANRVPDQQNFRKDENSVNGAGAGYSGIEEPSQRFRNGRNAAGRRMEAVRCEPAVWREAVRREMARRETTKPAEPEPWGPDWEAALRTHGSSPEQINAWRSAFSEEHGRLYFYNTSTGERTWELPKGASVSDEVGVASRSLVRSTAEAIPWRCIWSEEHGQRYFWNEATGEIRWDLPEVSEATSGSGDVEWC